MIGTLNMPGLTCQTQCSLCLLLPLPAVLSVRYVSSELEAVTLLQHGVSTLIRGMCLVKACALLLPLSLSHCLQKCLLAPLPAFLLSGLLVKVHALLFLFLPSSYARTGGGGGVVGLAAHLEC